MNTNKHEWWAGVLRELRGLLTSPWDRLHFACSTEYFPLTLTLSRNDAVEDGERARLGRSGLRPRGPHGTRKSGHCWVRSFVPVFGARARRTAAEAAALPIHFDCIVPTEGEGQGEGEGNFRPQRDASDPTDCSVSLNK